MSRTLWIVALALPTSALAQPFNIDLDIGGSGPASSFGGAANQNGTWDSVWGWSPSLLDLNGNASGVALTVTTSGGGLSGGWWNNPINTGDFELLLNDGWEVAGSQNGGWIQLTFSGIANGAYDIYTYAVSPVPGQASYCEVTIAGSMQVASGNMPGNAFILGTTHVIHPVTVTGNTLVITGSIPGGLSTHALLNGIQIVPVPAPAAAATLALAAVASFRRRR